MTASPAELSSYAVISEHMLCMLGFVVLNYKPRTKQPQKVPQKMPTQEFWGLHCIKTSKSRKCSATLFKYAHIQSSGWNAAIIIKWVLCHSILKKLILPTKPWDLRKNRVSSPDSAEHALLIFNCICIDRSNNLATFGFQPHLVDKIQFMLKFSHPRLLRLLKAEPPSPETPRPVTNKRPTLQKSWYFCLYTSKNWPFSPIPAMKALSLQTFINPPKSLIWI